MRFEPIVGSAGVPGRRPGGGDRAPGRARDRDACRRSDQHEPQGHDPAGRYVVRISGKDSGLLAIDRENEVHNTIAAAETGVGAPVVAALPEHDALVLEFLDGEVMDAEKLKRGDRLPSVAAACRRLHRARHFLRDFDMFDIQRAYVRVCTERGFRFPARYHKFEPAPARSRRRWRS